MRAARRARRALPRAGRVLGQARQRAELAQHVARRRGRLSPRGMWGWRRSQLSLRSLA
jgi:hypothetical protein